MEWDKGEGGIRRELCFGQEGEEGRSGQNKERKELTAMQEEEVRPPRDGTGEEPTNAAAAHMSVMVRSI